MHQPTFASKIGNRTGNWDLPTVSDQFMSKCDNDSTAELSGERTALSEGAFMSLELVNTLATLGTFIVIAATAIAAMIQLRHARSSNQIAALNKLMEVQQTQEFKAARHFVHTELAGMLQDPAFRHQLWLFVNEKGPTVEAEHRIAKVSTLGDFYENLGLLVKRGFVDRASTLDVWSYAVSQEWERLEPIVLRYRRAAGDAIYENFEYLVVLSQDWIAAHPNGTYPAGIRRIKLRDDPWLEADKQYAASIAPA